MSRARVCVLVFGLLVAAVSVPAAPWGAFVEASDSSLDPAIIEAAATGDFDTRLAICEAMGRRADPRADRLLLWLLTVSGKGERCQAEHLLRVLLESLFAPQHGPETLQQRYTANRESLTEAQARWSTFSDTQLRAALLRILPLFERDRALPFLMAAGSGLVRRLRETRGVLPPGETGLVLDFLAVVEQVHSPDFLEPCLSISMLSREKPVIDRARRVTGIVRAELEPAARPAPR